MPITTSIALRPGGICGWQKIGSDRERSLTTHRFGIPVGRQWRVGNSKCAPTLKVVRGSVEEPVLVQPLDPLVHSMDRAPQRVFEIMGDEKQPLAFVHAAKHVLPSIPRRDCQ